MLPSASSLGLSSSQKVQNNGSRGPIISEVLAKGLAGQTSRKYTKLDEKTGPLGVSSVPGQYTRMQSKGCCFIFRLKNPDPNLCSKIYLN